MDIRVTAEDSGPLVALLTLALNRNDCVILRVNDRDGQDSRVLSVGEDSVRLRVSVQGVPHEEYEVSFEDIDAVNFLV